MRLTMVTLSVLMALASLTACKSVVAEPEGAPVDASTYVEFDTFAWDDRPAAREDGKPVLDEAVSAAVKKQVEAELLELGIYPAERKDASLLVSQALSVRTRQRSKDPYFTFYVAERWEEGLLTLEFRDARERSLVWRGRGRSELRVTARGNGVTSIRYTDTDEERKWPVAEMIDSILDQSGLRGAVAARKAGTVGPPPFLRKNAKRSLYRRIYDTVPDDKSWLIEGAEK
jgi:Domain of unknown function (DUF4136)